MENLDSFPIWLLGLSMVVVSVVIADIGFRFGVRLQDRGANPGDSRMTGTVVGGMLGLVGFLMAFAIGIAIGNFSERKGMVVTEANAIGVAWLRAGFLEEPDSQDLRDLLRAYAQVRLDAANRQVILSDAVEQSEMAHADMWRIIQRNVRQGNESDVMVSLAEAVNAVISAHSLRLAAAFKRLPDILGQVLAISIVLSFFLVGVASSADRKRDTAAIFMFALVFTAVFMILVDIDRPTEGTFVVSQTAMTDLLRQITPLER
jgi:hypothetical protein